MAAFYRAILGERPTAEDFTSNKAKGKPRRAPHETEEMWAGISVYTTEERCRKKAAQFGLGTYVAALEIPDDAPIGRGKPSKGHCTLWGESDDFLPYVVAITPVEPPEEG